MMFVLNCTNDPCEVYRMKIIWTSYTGVRACNPTELICTESNPISAVRTEIWTTPQCKICIMYLSSVRPSVRLSVGVGVRPSHFSFPLSN